MIWTIIIVSIILIIIFRFFSDRNKDNEDLYGTTAPEKFSIIVDAINEYAYNGCAQVITLDKRRFYLFLQNSNQIIIFMYSTGHFSVDWKYKYYQKEVVYSRQFNNVRDADDQQQMAMASVIIAEASRKIERHKDQFWTN